MSEWKKSMNGKIFADLHNHTKASDGDFTSGELVAAAKNLGIKVVGVTNHDTIAGLKSAVDAGKKYRVEVIPGVEVSVRFKQRDFTGTLHLLCYFSVGRLADETFVRSVQAVLSRGRGMDLMKTRVDEINRWFGPDGNVPKLSRPMTYEDISTLSRNASRRHFALALQQAFRISEPDEINTIIANDSPAYVPSGIDLETAMALVKEQDLLSVLAHPAAGSFPGKGHYKEVLPPIDIVERLLPDFMARGLHGLEVYYPGHVKAHEQLVASWAKTHGLLITGGSDCHDGKNRPLGVSGIDEFQFKQFKAALK